ncbi:hypothetical protein [Falsigemmobacter faecalis]|uniref:Uncharacterized protein n=1 Tax=Falsigemmobacter faecalis TaxID=2488730 RepID=A0A3P3DPQ2_9RHOB|nr:hypothetical protein [Falsigemmobacter faecalis]RRH76210.1 hypothetical protein EG244_07310 [Falsigemmobacter faecalis]
MLKSLLSVTLAVLAASPMAAAAPRLLPLGSDGPKAPLCTADRSYCSALIGADTLELSYKGQSVKITGLPLRPGETAEPDASLIELSPGHLLAGVIIARDEGMDYGRFRRRDLLLWDVNLTDGSIVGPVFDFPVHGLVNTEYDCRNWPQDKRPDCRAEYEFNTRFDFASAETEGYPVLTYSTAAVMTPGGASREYGWGGGALIGSSPMGMDQDCTFRRSIVWNPLSGRYLMDSPMPDCDQYLERHLLPRRGGTEVREVWMRPATEAELRRYVSPETQTRNATALKAPRYELGWIYNEMFSGNDIVLLRISDGGRCEEGNCDLHFFATGNCVDASLCTTRWLESRRGNRVYTTAEPEDPLSGSCPQSQVLIPVGADRGQYCLTHKGLQSDAAFPADFARRFPKE